MKINPGSENFLLSDWSIFISALPLLDVRKDLPDCSSDKQFSEQTCLEMINLHGSSNPIGDNKK
jgi:hypothetical protein